MFLFPLLSGCLPLPGGSYFSVQDEPSAYDANFLAGIRFGQRRKEDSCHREQPLSPAFVPKVFGINSGRLNFAPENTPGGKGMARVVKSLYNRMTVCISKDGKVEVLI